MKKLLLLSVAMILFLSGCCCWFPPGHGGGHGRGYGGGRGYYPHHSHIR